jgi:hypothetical protein
MGKKDKPAVSYKNFPEDLIGRVNAKAALLGLGQAEYVIEIFEEQTADLKDIQERLKKEREAKKKLPKSVVTSTHEGRKG